MSFRLESVVGKHSIVLSERLDGWCGFRFGVVQIGLPQVVHGLDAGEAFGIRLGLFGPVLMVVAGRLSSGWLGAIADVEGDGGEEFRVRGGPALCLAPLEKRGPLGLEASAVFGE